MNPLFLQEIQELYAILKKGNPEITFGTLIYSLTRDKKPKDFLTMSDLDVINLIREVQLNETEY